MNPFIQSFLIYMQVQKNASNATLKAYQSDLIQLETYLKEQKITFHEASIEQILDFLGQYYTRRTTYNRKISTYRDFYRFLNKKYHFDFDYTLLERVKLDKVYPRIIKKEDIGKMIACCKENTIGKRNKTIIMMLYITGLRVSELISLTFNDLNIKEGYLRVIGKGNKERVIYAGELLSIVLTPYLEHTRKEILQGLPSTYLFVNSNGEKIRRETIYRLVNDCAKKAQIHLKVTPHTLRHCFATHMLENGADIRSIQEMLGHSNISTTQIYTNLKNETIKKAYYDGMKNVHFYKEEDENENI